jgi:hypothetical protein
MSKIIYFFKEVREEWLQARRQLDIYLSLQRYISRSKKQTATGKVMYE